MPTAETITCDPSQFISGRTELGLDDLGLAIRGDGADWGDSEIELFLVRQALGEIPADRHPPNRQVSIPLMVMEEGAQALPTSAAKLQKKIGLWQREGGFIRRDLDPASGFTSAVATQVRGASLAGLQGWMMAHRDKAPEVTLNLVTGPYFYGINEIESAEFKAENVGHLKWEIANIKGSAPGLVRVSVKNEGAVDWRGLLAAMESRDLAGAGTRGTTADIAYECEALTLAGESTVAEGIAEASNGKTVKNTKLTGGFISVLSSKTLASGHMSHTGPRRFWIRAKDFSPSQNVELKLVWRPLSSAQWSENDAVRFQVQNAFAKLDLGEVIPEGAVLGEQRWEWKILARASNPAVGVVVELDVLYILPTEQMLSVNTPPIELQPDAVSTKSPGTVTGEGEWKNPANAVSSNNVYATAEVPHSELGKIESTGHLKTSKHGFAIPEAATILGILVEVERKSSIENWAKDKSVILYKAGVAQTGGYKNRLSPTFWPTADTYFAYGGSSDLWDNTWTPAEINAEGFGFSISATKQGFQKTPTVSIDHIKISVYYSTATDENKVCFASRSIELRSDGVFRQHLTDNVWGRGVPDGFLPYAPPSGLEARAVRGVLAPSRGDHLAVADAGNHKLSAIVRYFPGYLFVSEI